MLKVRKASSSLSPWVFQQVNIRHCRRLSKVLLISLLRATLWYLRCDREKLVFTSQRRSNIQLMNQNVMRMARPTSKAPLEITLTFWRHFYTQLAAPHAGMGANELARAHTNSQAHAQAYAFIYLESKQQTTRHVRGQTSIQSPISRFPLSPVSSLFILHFLSISLALT